MSVRRWVGDLMMDKAPETEKSLREDLVRTHFPIIGERYLEAGRVRRGLIGAAPSLLFPIRDLVDFAVVYFGEVL